MRLWGLMSYIWRRDTGVLMEFYGVGGILALVIFKKMFFFLN